MVSVLINQEKKIPDDTELKLKGEKLKYVSRGGLKLEKALENLKYQLKAKRPLILELQQEALRMSCFKMVRNWFMPLMLGPIS